MRSMNSQKFEVASNSQSQNAQQPFESSNSGQKTTIADMQGASRARMQEGPQGSGLEGARGDGAG